MARRKPASALPPSEDVGLLARLALLNQRAQLGDTAAVDAIRKVLDTNPHIWEEQGDLGRQLRNGWLRLAAEAHPVRTECVRRHVEEVEKSLTEPSTGRAGRLLASRAATCFLVLQVADAEALAAANRKDSDRQRDVMARQAAAERMFQSSLKSLAAHQELTRSPPSPAVPPGPVDEQAPAAAATG
jgi:hypothetical protein